MNVSEESDPRPLEEPVQATKKAFVRRRPGGRKPIILPPLPPAIPATEGQAPLPKSDLRGHERYLTLDEKGRLRTATSYRAPREAPTPKRPGKKKKSEV